MNSYCSYCGHSYMKRKCEKCGRTFETCMCEPARIRCYECQDFRLLVCGDRNWSDKELIKEMLKDRCYGPTYLIHGGCRGADTIAGEVAQELDKAGEIDIVAVGVFEPDWERFGRAAGPIRNKRMLEEGPDLVLAFHDDLTRSKGTADMVEKAKKMGIEVEMVGH